MGSARGVGGIAMNTSLMEMVPPHLMGRVQNTFYFFGTFLQLVLALAVGAVAHNVSLVAAFAILACVYGFVVRCRQLAGRNRLSPRRSGRQLMEERLTTQNRRCREQCSESSVSSANRTAQWRTSHRQLPSRKFCSIHACLRLCGKSTPPADILSHSKEHSCSLTCRAATPSSSESPTSAPSPGRSPRDCTPPA